LTVHYLLAIGAADLVLVVPVFQHAFEKKLSPFALRLSMCRAAFDPVERVEVSEIESKLPAPNYTLNTILALRQERPEASFRLVVGADVLADTEHWHRFEEVCDLAPPFVLGRAGFDDPRAPPVVLPEVSSTQVRTWFQASAPQGSELRKEALIPQAVREVIEREQLYR
jgi:nicotinate-nucleotide adenylyltransferase